MTVAFLMTPLCLFIGDYLQLSRHFSAAPTSLFEVP